MNGDNPNKDLAQTEITELRLMYSELSAIACEMVTALDWYANQIGGSVKDPAAKVLTKWRAYQHSRGIKDDEPIATNQ